MNLEAPLIFKVLVAVKVVVWVQIRIRAKMLSCPRYKLTTMREIWLNLWSNSVFSLNVLLVLFLLTCFRC